MSIEIKVPNLPESVSSATVAVWHVAAGESVEREQNLVDLETDKVMLEVPATAGGVLKEIRVSAGATVQAGDVLGILDEGADTGSGDAQPAAKRADAGDSEAPQSPAVRKLLAELGLSAAGIEGSGKGGRLTVEDVRKHAAGKDAKPAPAAPAASAAPGSAASNSSRAVVSRDEQRVPMTRIRQRIAERLVEAQSTAAMLTTFNEVDLKAVGALRSRHKGSFEKSHGVKLGYMSFFVKAAIEALKKYPAVNASIDGTDVVYHSYYDIGVAVSTERGLVVPVLPDADLMSFADIEQRIVDLGQRARENKLTMEELTGGTFSITNGGVFGSMMSTPILNPPQAAILGMHGIIDRPIVVDGEVQVRPMMYLALTYDHRLIDGREAVLFLRHIKEDLEDPARLLLQI